MNKNTVDFEELKKLKQSVDEIAGEVARAEAEILIAENNLAVDKRDDGQIDPEELDKRMEESKRLVRIRKIEANRVAAKLLEAEEALYHAVKQSTGPCIGMLRAKAQSEIEKLRKKLIPFCGETACLTNDFEEFALMIDPVSIRINHADEIMRGRDYSGDLAKPRASLIQKILDAEPLV